MTKVPDKEILEQDELDAKASAGDELKDETDGLSEADEAVSDGEENPEEEAAEAVEGKKGFLGKRAEKKEAKQVAALNEKITELDDKVKRQMAEFDNFRKRTDKEKSAMFETGARSVIEKILPVIDNFERGLATVPDEDKDSPLADGMNKIYKQFMTELGNIGVKQIEAVGLEFNPELHNAVMQVESNEFESGFVAQELQKGYTYRDGVVRHSMVAVVQ